MQLEVAQGSRLDRGAPAGALMLARDLPAELAPFQAPKTLIFTQKYFYLCIFGKEIQCIFFFFHLVKMKPFCRTVLTLI